MPTKQEVFIATRADALRRGDRGVFKTMTAELHRLGYVEPAPLPEAGEFPVLDASALSQVEYPETTQATAPPSRAIPIAPRRGRPPKIRD